MKDPRLQQWLLAPGGIATRLRELRGTRTGREIADASGLRPAKVSKLELGQQIPTVDDIQALAAASGAGPAVIDELTAKLAEMPSFVAATNRRERFGLLAQQELLNEEMASARTIRVCAMTQLPRMVQDATYAAAALAGHALLTDDHAEVPAAAAQVAESSRFLLDPAKRIELIVAEPALIMTPATEATHRACLALLQSAIALPHVRFGVLPLGVTVPVLPESGFHLHDDKAWWLTAAGIQAATITTFEPLMKELWTCAATGKHARSLLRSAIDRLAG